MQVMFCSWAVSMELYVCTSLSVLSCLQQLNLNSESHRILFQTKITL